MRDQQVVQVMSLAADVPYGGQWGVCRCSMYWRMTAMGAPLQLPAKLRYPYTTRSSAFCTDLHTAYWPVRRFSRIRVKQVDIVRIRKNMELFSELGFHWNRSAVPGGVPIHSIERVAFRFYRMMPEFVWDASVLEGNPFTFPEVKTLLEGVTIGGRKISDQEQVLNLATSSKHLLALVKAGKFSMDKLTFTELHGLVARNESLEWGHFRGEGQETGYTPDVGLGEYGRYTPLATVAGAPELNRVFTIGLQALQTRIHQPFERAAAFFLFGALQQFFFDGNKRTSRFMMNGILMSAGIDGISVPAAKAQQFNENMVRFYLEKDATEMMAFLVDCHPDAEQIHKLNRNKPTTENDSGVQP